MFLFNVFHKGPRHQRTVLYKRDESYERLSRLKTHRKTDERSLVSSEPNSITQDLGFYGCCMGDITVQIRNKWGFELVINPPDLTILCSPTWKKKTWYGNKYCSNDDVTSAINIFIQQDALFSLNNYMSIYIERNSAFDRISRS